MTLVLLLLDGRRLTTSALAVFALVVLAVCAAGNYGYALNELFDLAEDARSGRANAAAAASALRTLTRSVIPGASLQGLGGTGADPAFSSGP